MGTNLLRSIFPKKGKRALLGDLDDIRLAVRLFSQTETQFKLNAVAERLL